jgi:hypothetical protein
MATFKLLPEHEGALQCLTPCTSVKPLTGLLPYIKQLKYLSGSAAVRD